MIADTLQEEVLASLQGTAVAAMLFGSFARGDEGSSSDIDVLQLVENPMPSYKVGKMVVTRYTTNQLTKLAEQGSLFVLHLRTEGMILHDPANALRTALDAYVSPESYDKVLDRIRLAAAVLHVSDHSPTSNTSGIVSLGIYLLRTLVYIRCVQKGIPAFSLSRAAEVIGSSQALDLLKRRREVVAVASASDAKQILSLIEDSLGRKIEHLGSTIAAVAVNATKRDREAGSLVTGILLGDRSVRYELLVGDAL